MDSRTVGVLGGGQLGRMMVEAGVRLGIRLAVLDPQGPSSPAGQLSAFCTSGSFQDNGAITQLSSVVDVITTEIEHVNVGSLDSLEAAGQEIHPSCATLRTIQDKLVQKTHLSAHNIPVSDSRAVLTVEDATQVGQEFGYPFMLKNRKLAYDGRGNIAVRAVEEIPSAITQLGGVDLYAERWVNYVKELAVMVVRTTAAATPMPYPVVETIQRHGICHAVIAPAQISQQVREEATRVAVETASSFTGSGVFGIELFLLADDTILVNEVAPRPHNSGHYTIEACEIDQFEIHLRAVLQLPCPPPRMKVPYAMMINILGDSSHTTAGAKQILRHAMTVPGAAVHWYGKNENRVDRKLAHVTITAESMEVLHNRVATFAADFAALLCDPSAAVPRARPRVGILMGSDSDLHVMKAAAELFDDFDIPYELTIVSAHRTPSRMYTYAHSAVERGLQVLITGAGGAAHLPGMIAAMTALPVIGVPIAGSNSNALRGQDALLSIVQMPRGVPVATVAIDNALNAGLLAVRILGIEDDKIRQRLDEYMTRQEEDVLDKAETLERVGYREYLAPRAAAEGSSSQVSNNGSHGCSHWKST